MTRDSVPSDSTKVTLARFKEPTWRAQDMDKRSWQKFLYTYPGTGRTPLYRMCVGSGMCYDTM